MNEVGYENFCQADSNNYTNFYTLETNPQSSNCRIKVNPMSESLACNLWQQVPPIWTQDEEPMQKLSVEIRVSGDVTVVYCRGRIVYDEAATLSQKLADL